MGELGVLLLRFTDLQMLPNFWSLNMSNFEFLSWKLDNPYRNQSYYCRWNFWLCSRNFPPNVETHPKRSSLLLLMCDTSAFYTLWPAVRLHLWKNIKKKLVKTTESRSVLFNLTRKNCRVNLSKYGGATQAHFTLFGQTSSLKMTVLLFQRIDPINKK